VVEIVIVLALMFHGFAGAAAHGAAGPGPACVTPDTVPPLCVARTH
jgi:hypothetical protein